MTYEGNDIYCDVIIPRAIAITVIKETDYTLAYEHTEPHWPVHVVVTPKQHIDSLLALPEVDEAIKADLEAVITDISASIVKEHGACRVLTNLGNYQDSKHLHFHLTFGTELR